MTRSIGSERLLPRTYGITQNEQRLSHPSCTFRLGRVRSLAASNTGAARSSVCAKISPTTMLGCTMLGCSILSRFSPTDGIDSLSPESCCNGTKPDLEDDGTTEVAISAARCLCEFPTTHVTPGSAAN